MADHDSSPSPHNLRFPDWRREFEAALLEVDPQKLPERVKAAEAGIFLRQQALVDNPDGHAERQAMDDAMSALGVIQTEERPSAGVQRWRSYEAASISYTVLSAS